MDQLTQATPAGSRHLLDGIINEMVADAHVPRFSELAHDLDAVLAGKRIITWNSLYVRELLSAEIEWLGPGFYGAQCGHQ